MLHMIWGAFGWPDLKYRPHSIPRVTPRTTEIQPQGEVRVMICWKRCSTMPGTKETHSGFQNEHEVKLIRLDAIIEHPFVRELLLTWAALLSACAGGFQHATPCFHPHLNALQNPSTHTHYQHPPKASASSPNISFLFL